VTIYLVVTYVHKEGKPMEILIGRAFKFKSTAEIEIIGRDNVDRQSVTQSEVVAIELVEE
jgi:hypothetical protein